MTAQWSRVWQAEGSCSSESSSCGCPSSCYNFVGNQYDPCKSILNEFPACVTSVAQAMRVFAGSLASRLGASTPIVQSNGDTNFTIIIRMNRRADSKATISLRLASGSFPVSCSYVYGAYSGLSSFGDLSSMEDWLISELRK